MKSCPECKRGFPDEAGFCPADGSPLQTASMVPAATGDDPRLGALLSGRYEIRRVVADGGMGRVYEGIDRATQTRIAVKVLHSDVAQDPVSLERFKREYEISSALPHDHIVKVLDFQRDPVAGVWLLVMEFLDGEELRYVLKREKTIPPERVIRLLSQVAIGLDAAHARQIVHRDLKPDNLFLCGTRDGDVVKILDFGSVKDKSKDAKKLTALGTTIGSPYYMAPEQAQGLDTLDARADVFALGAITYECLTGSVPFNGSNGPSILLAILTKDPEPASTKTADAKRPIPVSMDDVLEVALAKNANIRTTSVGELAMAVGKAYGLEGEPRVWASTPIGQLAQLVEEGLQRLNASSPENAAMFSAGAATDPFAVTPRAEAGNVQELGLAGTVAAGGAPVAAWSSAPRAAVEEPPVSIPGVGRVGARPWLVPVLVGVVALVAGAVAGITLLK
jgi:serine/threonine protein kinase